MTSISRAKLYTKTKYHNPFIFIGLVDIEKRKPQMIIRQSPTVAIIKSLLPKYYNCEFSDINNKSRIRDIVYVKHHFITLVRETTFLSLNSIGAIFDYKTGGIDHSSVVNSITAWNNLLSYDKEKQKLHDEFKAEVKELIK